MRLFLFCQHRLNVVVINFGRFLPDATLLCLRQERSSAPAADAEARPGTDPTIALWKGDVVLSPISAYF